MTFDDTGLTPSNFGQKLTLLKDSDGVVLILVQDNHNFFNLASINNKRFFVIVLCKLPNGVTASVFVSTKMHNSIPYIS